MAKHWSSASAQLVDNVGEAGAVHALDAIVFNEARHGRNLLLVDAPGGRVRLISIDADEALIGHPDELRARGLVPPDPRILARGLPAWREAAMLAAQRAATIPMEDLEGLVLEACGVAREPRVAEVFRALADRCTMASALTSRYVGLVEQRR